MALFSSSDSKITYLLDRWYSPNALEDQTKAHDERLPVYLQEVLCPDRPMEDLPGSSTATPAIWEDSGTRRACSLMRWCAGLQISLLGRLDMVEGDIGKEKNLLTRLYEEREFGNAMRKQDLYNRVPEGYLMPWYEYWRRLKIFLEPEYERQWRNAVAETENFLAIARDEADDLRRQVLMSRLKQLEQMVSERSRAQRTYTASEPFVKAHLNEREISAFPDTGAAANFISLQYAEAHGLKIDRISSNLVKLGNGSTVSTLGTTTSLFAFAGEKATHTLLFHVLRTSLYDVVLGSPFLKATETLTRYAHRIGRRCREALSHHVCALGASQRVSGRLNGVHMDATPDTGSDVSLMSASLAARHKLKVNTDKQHRVLLEFADGSTATATGLVENLEWRYGDTGDPYRMDVYVLPQLSVDLLLGYDFLHDTNAFVAYEGDFWSGDDVEKQAFADEVAITWLFWIIKLVRKAVKDQRDWGSRKSSSHRSFPGPHELT
jgi:predicted aspartyl protease